MNELLKVENVNDGRTIEYEVLTMDVVNDDVDAALQTVQDQIDEINQEIKRYTNEADWLDDTVAVASGVLCGILDAVCTDEFSFETAHEVGKDKIEGLVCQMAKSNGYKGDENDLCGAVRFLEKKFPLAADKATNDFGGGYSHHLRDFSHHPTPVGLFFSLLTQFTEDHLVFGTDVTGKFVPVKLGENAAFLIGKNTPEKITFGVINWFFHMASDMAGSSGSIAMGKEGTSLPGPIGSLLKELSALPIFKKKVGGNEFNADYKAFSVWVSKLYNGTLLGEKDENGKMQTLRFDLRTEVGIAEHLEKQAMPVLLNECIVRAFYFIRRFINEVKAKHIRSFKDLKKIEPKNVLPAKNRTIVRMLTISSGVFTAVDMADAAIRAVSSGGNAVAFAVRVNFVGVGRFAVAAGCDAFMGAKKEKLERQKRQLTSQMLFYKEAKVFYKTGDTWEALSDADKAVEVLSRIVAAVEDEYVSNLRDMNECGKKIEESKAEFLKNNPQIANKVLDILLEE